MLADEPSLSQQHSHEAGFEGGVHFGIGGFNLVSALSELAREGKVYFLVMGYWGCATRWGCIFTSLLTIMGSSLQTFSIE